MAMISPALAVALLCAAASHARAADFDDDAARISLDLVRQAKQSQDSKAGVVVPRDWAPELGLTLISLNEAKALFDHFKSQNDLMWQYVEEGCFARAHLMAHEMERKRGIISDKIFAYPVSGGSLTPPVPGGVTQWNFHVAPVVLVKNGEEQVPYVLDPVLDDRPITLTDWRKKLDIFKSGSIRFIVLPRFAFRYGRKYELADRWNPSELSEAREKLEQLDNERLNLNLFLRRNNPDNPAM